MENKTTNYTVEGEWKRGGKQRELWRPLKIRVGMNKYGG